MAIIRVYRHIRLCAACFLSCLVTCVSAGSAPALGRPNILILLTDDQRWDTICANNPSLKIAFFDLIDADLAQVEAFHDHDGRRVHDSEWLTLRTRDFLDAVPPDKPFPLQVNYKATWPGQHRRIAAEIEKRGCSWEDALVDPDLRFEIGLAAGYFY